MKKLILASHNERKVREIAGLLKDIDVEVVSAAEYGIGDIPETGETFAENAKQKTDFVANVVKGNYIFADDSGFCVDAMDGKPGVLTARFADHNPSKGIEIILENLKDLPNEKRGANFTVIFSLYTPSGETYFFEGVVKGKVALERRGDLGFAYDPIFIPDGYDRTFGEMSMEEKSTISHRGIALRKLVDFLKDK